MEELQRHTHLLFSLESMHNLAQNGRVSKLAATVVEKNGELFFMHLKNDLSRIVALRVHLEGNIVVDIGSIHEIRQTRVARKAFPVKGERQPRRQEDHDDLTTPHEIRMHKCEKETAHGHATPQ